MIRATAIGSLAEQMREEYEAGERAVKAAMVSAGRSLQGDWRRQIAGAGLGMRLPRTIRMRAYPAGDSMSAAALVWTTAPKVIAAFDEGPVIRSRSGFWLAIPTPAAGSRGLGRKRITPGGWEQRTGLKLRFVYRRARLGLLVAEARVNTRGMAVMSRSKTGRGLATVPIFILVPQVKLRKRLHLERAADKWGAAIPDMIVSNWPDE